MTAAQGSCKAMQGDKSGRSQSAELLKGKYVLPLGKTGRGNSKKKPWSEKNQGKLRSIGEGGEEEGFRSGKDTKTDNQRCFSCSDL